MYVPIGYTEQEVLAAIDDAVRGLANAFKFGYHEAADMEQEGRLFALEVLPDYDPFNAKGCSLKNYLRIHVRSRFINMRRNKLERLQPPCLACPLYDMDEDRCMQFEQRADCDKWQGWYSRNAAKRNLMEGGGGEDIEEHSEETNFVDAIANQELLAIVDAKMPLALRADYLRWKDGVKLPKNRRDRIIECVLTIIRENSDVRPEEG